MISEQKSLYLNVATLEYLFQTLPIDVYGITSSTLKISQRYSNVANTYIKLSFNFRIMNFTRVSILSIIIRIFWIVKLENVYAKYTYNCSTYSLECRKNIQGNLHTYGTSNLQYESTSKSRAILCIFGRGPTQALPVAQSF